MSEREQDMARVQKALDLLSEHFDTVQIFVTRHEDGGTRAANLGSGNWYARYGWREENEED